MGDNSLLYLNIRIIATNINFSEFLKFPKVGSEAEKLAYSVQVKATSAFGQLHACGLATS